MAKLTRCPQCSRKLTDDEAESGDNRRGLCHECWAFEQTPDQWDATVASANTGGSEDYSYLDDEED